jgi:hypothetical protein
MKDIGVDIALVNGCKTSQLGGPGHEWVKALPLNTRKESVVLAHAY